MKVLLWLKTYWYIPLVTIVVVLISVLSVGRNTLPDKWWQFVSNQRKSYLKQVNDLNEIRKKEIEQKQVNIEKYKETISEIEEKHDNSIKEIEEKKEKRVEEILEETNNDQDELAKRIQEEFGFKGEK